MRRLQGSKRSVFHLILLYINFDFESINLCGLANGCSIVHSHFLASIHHFLKRYLSRWTIMLGGSSCSFGFLSVIFYVPTIERRSWSSASEKRGTCIIIHIWYREFHTVHFSRVYTWDMSRLSTPVPFITGTIVVLIGLIVLLGRSKLLKFEEAMVSNDLYVQHIVVRSAGSSSSLSATSSLSVR